MVSRNDQLDEELVRVWAARFRRWGIGDLVPIAVDILRPFGFLGAQALHMLVPVLTTFSSPAQIDQLTSLLESPEALERLSDAFSTPNQD